MLHSLRSRLVITLMGIVVITVTSLMLVVKGQADRSINTLLKSNADNLLAAIVNTVENEYDSIEFHRRKALEWRKEELKNVVDIAHAILTDYRTQAQQGIYSEEQAQELAEETIKGLRWSDDVGYLWINDTTFPTPIMIMHPTQPELDGKVLDDPDFNCALGRNENLFRAFNNVCQASGSGFVDYLWPKPAPGGKLSERQPKLSYVRLFEPWNWIIGTGVYIDDIDSEAQDRLNAVIMELRRSFLQMDIGESSYLFLFTKDKKFLIHPMLEGQNVERLQNPDTGRHILDEIMLTEQAPEKTMDYRWEKPQGASKEIFRKRLYVRYFEPLQWYVCVSYYLDEVERPVWELGWRMVLLSVLFLTAALLLSYVLGKSLTKPLSRLAVAADAIEKEGIGSVEIPISGSTETRELGAILARTMQSLGEKERSLSDSREQLKNSEKSLYQQLQVTKTLLRSIPMPLYFKDMDGKFVECNQAFADFVGLEIEAIRGKTARDLWRSSVSERIHKRDAELLASPGCLSEEMRIIAGDGKPHHIILHKDVFFDESGQVAGLVGSFLDVTERLEAENRIRESEENLRITLDSIDEGVICTDGEGRIVRMNAVAEALMEWSMAEAQNRVLLDGIKLIDPDSKEPIDNPISEVLHSRRVIKKPMPKIMISRGGLRRVIADNCVPITGKNRALLGAVYAFRDITEQVRTEEQLRQSQKMDSLGQLSGGIAHDFNNMLAAMLGAAEILNSKLSADDANRKLVRMIINSVEQAADLTGKLLAFSRKGKMLSTPLDVHDSIIDAVEILRRSIDKRIQIVQQLGAEVSTIVGDPSQIQNMIINLGLNAGYAMPSGGTLTIATANVDLDEMECSLQNFHLVPGCYVEIRLQDTGVGIRQELLGRIFEPFFTTKGVGEGTGLGLAAVYGSVKEHFGAVTVSSEPGVGTIFSILLPVHRTRVQRKNVDLTQFRKGTGTILVVDDEEIIRLTAEHALTDMGYTVITAKNGLEAIEIYRQRGAEIALVILDMVMPEMNGEDAFQEIKSINPDARILMASGFSGNNVIARLKKQKMTGFIQKPYRLFDLNRIIADLLAEG